MENVKEMVKEKYTIIADQSKAQNETSCCGATGCCSSIDYTVFSENYDKVAGYNPDADLGLGCGIPTEFAHIKAGDTVVDLGSGAGNDCFVARALVGASGKVIGIDMTEAMIEKARQNAEKLDFNNVDFRLGDIEKMPITANKADVIISNCVLNLVPDKPKAFAEIFRVLKPGGHFSISDVVISGDLPLPIQKAAEMYAGCVAGAIQKEMYLQTIKDAGFQDVRVDKEKQVSLPDELLLKYLTNEELKSFRTSGVGVYSVNIYAKKQEECGPGCECK